VLANHLFSRLQGFRSGQHIAAQCRLQGFCSGQHIAAQHIAAQHIAAQHIAAQLVGWYMWIFAAWQW
jgi:hypothetical protein